MLCLRYYYSLAISVTVLISHECEPKEYLQQLIVTVVPAVACPELFGLVQITTNSKMLTEIKESKKIHS